MTASTTNATKWAALNSNIAGGIVGDPNAIEAALDDIRTVVDQHASEINRAKPACRVYNDTIQSIPNNALTVLSFNGELYDNDTMHDNATNNSRITIKTAGKYRLSAIVEFASNATGIRQILLRVNGTIYIGAVTTDAFTTTQQMNVHADYQLAVGDYVEVIVYQNSGGALNVSNSSSTSRYKCEFMASLITE